MSKIKTISNGTNYYTSNKCFHCGKEYNHMLQFGLCAGCLNYEQHSWSNDARRNLPGYLTPTSEGKEEK